MSGFKIPELKMPTDEQHRAVSLKWLSRVQPTLMDRWPKELMAMSVPTTLIEIDVGRIWTAICDVHDGKEVGHDLKAMAMALDYYIGWNRKFVRLSSRSPKDNVWPFEVPAVVSGKEAVMMMVGSERVIEDLMEFRWVPEQPAYVAIRDFDHRIRGDNEFRCFVKNGDLIAVTHYDYTKTAPKWIRDGQKQIRAVIDDYFVTQLKPVLHVEAVVFDIAITRDKSVILIEINPYGLSDPCHFGSYENVEKAESFIEIGHSVLVNLEATQ